MTCTTNMKHATRNMTCKHDLRVMFVTKTSLTLG